MIYLLIDTSSKYACVSIVKDNDIIFKFDDIIEDDMSSKILPIIDDGLKSNNFYIKDINKIFVVNGPGSFTGIRIGVTIAKVIAWGLNISVVPISSLELLATTQTSKKYIVPMIDARRGNVFAGIYDNNLNIIKGDSLVNLNDLISKLNDDYEFVSNDSLDLKNIVKPDIDILKIINKYKDSKGINPHKLNPNYLKLTEAEENRNKND